ncbi:hypothetical protein HDV00_008439 [Rhizophlyctis rosea]|nr:hypothetical protein HDV00_008439 [Rhizophlyctis rosea]
MEDSSTNLPPLWAVALEYGFTVLGQVVCVINLYFGIRIIFLRHQVGAQFRWFNSLILLAFLCYFVSFIPMYVTTFIRANDGDAVQKAARIFELDRLFNGFFTTGALFYLLTMQGRIQLIRKVKAYSVYWDYFFVILTTCLWFITMWFSAFTWAEPLIHTLAGCLFAIYVTLSGNTLSLIFILTLYKEKERAGRTNHAAFYRVARALAIICTLSWLCAILGITALLGFRNNDAIRPLIFRVAYGVGGPMELSGVLLFIYEVRSLVLSPLPQTSPAPSGGKHQRMPGQNRVQDTSTIADGEDEYGRRKSLIDAQLIRALTKKLPGIQNAQSSDISMVDRRYSASNVDASEETLAQPKTEPATPTQSFASVSVPRQSRTTFSLNIRNNAPRGFATTSSHFSPSSNHRPSVATVLTGSNSSIVTPSASIIPTATPNASFATTSTSTIESTASSVRSAPQTPNTSFIGPTSSIHSHVPQTPNQSFISTTSTNRSSLQITQTPNQSFISTTSTNRSSLQVSQTPNQSFISTTSTNRTSLQIPQTPYASFASTASSVPPYPTPQTPYQSFATASTTSAAYGPGTPYQSATASINMQPQTPYNSYASAASSVPNGMLKKSAMKKPQQQQPVQEEEGEQGGEGVLQKLKGKLRVKWVNIVV